MSVAAPLDLATLADFPLPALPEGTDKNSRGRVLVVGGGAWGPGAPMLSALAALRAGAGKVQIAATERFAPVLATAVPEAAILTVPATLKGELSRKAGAALIGAAGRADAVVVGPGMLDDKTGAHLALTLAEADGQPGFVIDAGALTSLKPDRPIPAIAGRLVITPHAGEMASLLGRDKDRVVADPLSAAREVALGIKAVVVMKGASTFVVSPDGQAWLHRDGVVGLATSGSGDVLAGVIGGFLAQGASPLTAAAWGVCVHGEAGRRLSVSTGPTGFLARELLHEIPGVVAKITDRRARRTAAMAP